MKKGYELGSHPRALFYDYRGDPLNIEEGYLQSRLLVKVSLCAIRQCHLTISRSIYISLHRRDLPSPSTPTSLVPTLPHPPPSADELTRAAYLYQPTMTTTTRSPPSQLLPSSTWVGRSPLAALPMPLSWYGSQSFSEQLNGAHVYPRLLAASLFE
jgi:hypothetical protein